MKAFVFLGAVVLFFSPGRTFGDIAPTTYVGSAIVPVRAPGIRMVRATVDIAWGIPCTLTADFVMENTTAKPVEVLLGFPLNLPDALVKKDVLGFSMRFDDVPARTRLPRWASRGSIRRRTRRGIVAGTRFRRARRG
jgi:hypothetical protein